MADSAEKLWREYAFYNREMVKFMKQQDVEMFDTLGKELTDRQKKIVALPADDFIRTPSGQELLRELQANTRYLQQAIQCWLNNARRQQETTQAYDFLGQRQSGVNLNWRG